MRKHRRWVSVVTAGALLVINSGCCTIAHSGRVRQWNDDDGSGEVCPWLIGDALLLIPGIVPGVIAFIVDFSTGEWRHAAASTMMDKVPDRGLCDAALVLRKRLRSGLSKVDKA